MSDLFDIYNMFTRENKKTIVIFCGNFAEDIYNDLAKSLKSKLFGKEKKLSRRIFSVFVEMAQNIVHYSANRTEHDSHIVSEGIMHVYEENNCFVVQSGNAVHKNKIDAISTYLDMINSKSTDELTLMKKQALKKERKREGAGFGLVEVALKSKSKIDYDFKQVNEDYYFLKIQVTMNKENI